jgi:lysophospholipase L1-like esterase
MKRILLILLALLLAISMVACDTSDVTPQDGNNSGDTQNSGTGDTPSTGDIPSTGDGTTEQKPTVKYLKINGVDISEYKIVYAKNPDAYKYTLAKKVVKDNTEYDEQTAKNLAELIKTHFGVTVDVVRDNTEATDKEIIIGDTKRGLVDDTLEGFKSVKDISISEVGGKLVICGGSYGATWQAVEKFIEQCLATEGETCDIKTGYTYQTQADMLVVACIGDSLTYGTKPSNYTSKVDDSVRADTIPYPMVLQRLAWQTMCVYNYGKGGRTMTENHLWDSTNDGSLNTSQAEDRAWIKTAEHTACMKNAENFDLVLIMLGTNDANSGRAAEAGFNFDAIYERAFINGCKSIVNELKAKNPDVRIALLNCPVAFRADIEDYAARYIRKYQEKAAEQLGLDLLDMYTFTSTNTTSADYPDSLHPKDEGYITFAEGIYEMITPIVKQLLSK